MNSRGLVSSPFREYARTPQNAESPNFDHLFLTNLRLGMPDYTGSPLQVSHSSPNTDLSLHDPNSLGSQNKKKCLQNHRLTNYLLSSAGRCLVKEKSLLSPSAIDQTCPCMSTAKRLYCVQLFCCGSGALIASTKILAGVTASCAKLKAFCWIESFQGFTLPVGTWLAALKKSLRMDLTARGRGQVRRNSQSHTPQLRALSQRRIETKLNDTGNCVLHADR